MRALILVKVAFLSLACTAEERLPEIESRTHEPSGDEEATRRSKEPTDVAEPAPSQIDPSKQYPQPDAPGVALFQTGDSFVIEVRDPDGFPIRAEDPFLHVGDVILPSSGYSTRVGPYGLVYKLSRQQFEDLEEGAEMKLGRSGFPTHSYGTLEKSSLVVTKAGGTP